MGSGPNGLTAAILLAQHGLHTTVIEAEPQVGGAVRTAELTLPGFRHDVGSAVYPLAVASRAFTSFRLTDYGLKWIQPAAPVAHPLDDQPPVLACRSIEATCRRLGEDGDAYRRLTEPFVRRWSDLAEEVLQPLHVPSNPVLLARFGYHALWPAESAARRLFRTEAARALFAGHAAHSVLPLDAWGTSAFAWMLGISAHAVGWPMPQDGAQSITDALESCFRSLGGDVIAGTRITSLRELGRDSLRLFDLTPKPFLVVAGEALPDPYRRKLEKYRYGTGVFKMDWALRHPIPWKFAECSQAGTVHIGGSLEEIAAGEREVADGRIPERPFVLLAQPSLFDSTRAPAGQHTAWAYCHVPNGSAADMSGKIEAQIERFAPGFREAVLARRATSPADLENMDANLAGGDIVGGSQDLRQLFWRPSRKLYRTPLDGVYLCSSATPPGGGVHGMCGYYAAREALSDAGLL